MSKIPKRLLIVVPIIIFAVLVTLILKTKPTEFPISLLNSKNLLTVIFPNFSPPYVQISPQISRAATPTPGLYVVMTFYGWVDNDPPGKNIAFPKSRYPSSLHNQAGGIGTYSDPVTIAVKEGRWPPGTKMYVPILQKYGIVEDICANCNEDHIDVWMESNTDFRRELLSCERRYTKENTGLEINPLTNRPVSVILFFDFNTGKCN